MGGSNIRRIFLCLSLILVLIIVPRSEMDFEFKCEGSDGATMSSYSYFKESSLQESGYTRGLKAGSFNYLENSKYLSFSEKIKYKYSNGTAKGNSSYNHNMVLDFVGDRGISEFYGKEFFKNNRAISAWKKIRYEKIDPSYIGLGRSNMAKEIFVRGVLTMDTTPGAGYDLKYNANVKEGVIETWDASGWSNRTGARRIDWEHTSLMHGSVSVVNNLRERAPLVAHAGEEDWLPCCYTGTSPAIEPIYSPWPTMRVVKTLEADRILPQRYCGQGCYANGTCNTSSGCKDIKCTPENCQGFECMYTTDLGGLRGIAGSDIYNASTTGLYVRQTYVEDPSVKQVTYEINIKNTGDIKTNNIRVDDILPAGMSYTASNYADSRDGTLEKPKEQPNGDGTTTITWSIGDLVSDQSKTIRMVT
jgi:hypothetical protein